MTGNYSIKKGDTLFNIVKKQYNLTDKNEILAKAKEIANANNISDFNTIFTGKTIDFNKAANKSATNPALENSVFDGSDPSFQNFSDWEKASNRSENGTVKDFVFAKGYDEDYKQTGKCDSGIYKKELLSFAKNLVKGKDENGDGSIQYEEFKSKNKNVNDDRAKAAFDAEDLNHDGKIDETEQASVIAAMDADSKDQMNGKILSANFKDMSKNIGDKDKSKEVQAKIQKMHDFLFKEDSKDVAKSEAAKTPEEIRASFQKTYDEEFKKQMGGFGVARVSSFGNIGTLFSGLSAIFSNIFAFKLLKW